MTQKYFYKKKIIEMNYRIMFKIELANKAAIDLLIFDAFIKSSYARCMVAIGQLKCILAYHWSFVHMYYIAHFLETLLEILWEYLTFSLCSCSCYVNAMQYSRN